MSSKIVYLLFFPALVICCMPDVAAQEEVELLRQFRLTRSFTTLEQVEIDTAFTHFHRSRIADSYSPFNAYPGNYGQPLYQIAFFDRTTDPDHFLYNHYYPFVWIPEKAVFMDNRIPYIEMVFTYAGAAANEAEQNFRVRSSLNINRYLNVGLIYDIIYSLGQYSHQKSSNKNFLLHSTYIRDRYSLYAAVGVNNMYTNENGGVVDPLTIRQFRTRDVPVRLGGLNRAISTLRNRNLLLVQRYTPISTTVESDDTPTDAGISGTFTHVLLVDRNNRSYSDANPRSGFYDTVYFDTGSTLDSLFASRIANTGRFDFSFRSRGGFLLDAGGGIRHEYHSYSQHVWIGDTIYDDFFDRSHSNLSVVGSIENRIGKSFGWRAEGDLFFAGKRAGDFNISGEMYRDFGLKKGDLSLLLTGSAALVSPSVWENEWVSNHFIWSADLDKEFRIDAGAAIKYPERQFSAAFNYAIIDNYRYFDTIALPVKYNGALSVLSLKAEKVFTLGNFHQGNTLLLQQSSNRDVLSLPLATLRSSIWFERNFHFEITGGNLLIQAGAEAFLHTRYMAMAYMPATGRYHNQDQYGTGGYPFVNVFLNAKIKRTRILLSFDHLNAGFSGVDYNLVPRNPLNDRVFRYGIAWTFYD